MASTHLYCTTCGAANQAHDTFCFACGRPLRATTPLTQNPTIVSASNTSTGLLTIYHLLKQRYRILEQLGKGGFGAVYKAEDTQFGNRLVVVKEMSQSGLNSQQEIDEAAKAFEGEALMLAGLRHQNLPRIYDHFSDGGRWYLVMDFIEGETLEEHLQKAKGGYLSIQEILQIGTQLCTVLAYLHTHQPPIIFRDLKPANVMLTPDGHLYLIDFGIARHFKPGKTKDTIAFGSPGYASPEQYGKAQTTPRSDIYSLGATFHQMLTGIDPSQKPFQFAFPHSSGRFIPSSFSTLIMQMVEVDETRRPASMNVVKQELQQIATQPTGKTLLPIQPVGGAFLTPIPHSHEKNKIIGIAAGIVVVILVGAYLISAALVNHSLSASATSTPNSSSNSIITPTVALTTPPTIAPTTPPTVAPTPTSIPKSGPGTVLYQADWSNGLNGWTGSSDWKAFNNMLISDGTYVDTNGSQLSPTIEPPYQVSGSSDYAVEVRIQQVSGGCFDAAVIRGSVVSDGVQGYRLAIGCNGGATIYAAHGSTLNQIAHTDFSPGNAWHTYRLEAKGTTIRAFIDGLQILEVSDNVYLSGGVVGIKCVGTQVDVSSFKIIAV